jgi:regulator of sirC expression with transglutaminase-like and TPR domain
MLRVLGDQGQLPSRSREAALEAHSHAVTLSPGDCVAWYNRALVLEDLRDFDMAIQSYQRYLKVVPPGEPGVISARRRLESLRTHLAQF